jgi:hypothetical protein
LLPSTDHHPILIRIGNALIFVGVIDIAVMLYCIANHISYFSSFSFFALMAGAFLKRGSLRATQKITQFSAFLVSSSLTMLVVVPAIYPLQLLWVKFATHQLAMSVEFYMSMALLLALIGALRLLRHPALIAAQQRAGLRTSITLPLLLGCAFVVLMAVLALIKEAGPDHDRAQREAAAILGQNGYHYYVGSLLVGTRGGVKFVNGTVTAYNAQDFHDIPVAWQEILPP